MTKNKKIVIITTAVALALAILICGLAFLISWGKMTIFVKGVEYSRLQKLVGSDCIVPEKLDDYGTIKICRLTFPQARPDGGTPKDFYPSEIHAVLLEPAFAYAAAESGMGMSSIASVGPGPVKNFDFKPFKENPKSNGYEIAINTYGGERISIFARKPSAVENVSVGDGVNYLELPEKQTVNGTTITYFSSKNTEGRVDKYYVFKYGKAVYCFKFGNYENFEILNASADAIIGGMLG